jgi:hypothetical protein
MSFTGILPYDPNVVESSQRYKLYSPTIFFGAVGVALLVGQTGKYEYAAIISIAYLCTLSLVAVITNGRKPSAHVAAATGVVTAFCFLDWRFALAAPLVILVAWARIHKSLHSRKEVGQGALLGFLCFFACLMAWKLSS